MPTQAAPACCLPPELPPSGCLLKVVGPHEPLLTSGLKRNIGLAVWQLQAIINFLGARMPVNGEGSGKNKRVIRADLVRAVVNHVFANEMTEAEREKLIASLTGSRPGSTETAHPSPGEDCPMTHLKLISKLNPSEAPEFEVLKKQALDSIAEQQLKDAQRKKRESHQRLQETRAQVDEDVPMPPRPERPTFEEPSARTSAAHVKAPPEFKEFLPPHVDYVYFRWEPHTRRTSIEFQSALPQRYIQKFCYCGFKLFIQYTPRHNSFPPQTNPEWNAKESQTTRSPRQLHGHPDQQRMPKLPAWKSFSGLLQGSTTRSTTLPRTTRAHTKRASLSFRLSQGVGKFWTLCKYA